MTESHDHMTESHDHMTVSHDHMTVSHDHMTVSHDHLPHVHKPPSRTAASRGGEELQLTVPLEPSPHHPQSVTLCVRLPDGSRAQRRFDYSTHTLRDLLAFALISLPQEVGVSLSTADVELASSSVPKDVYCDWSLTLSQAGLTRNTLLSLSIL